MSRPTKLVIDCATGERKEITLSDAESAEREAAAAQAEQERLAQEAAEQAKADAKASGIAKLLALGLTEEEAQALVN